MSSDFGSAHRNALGAVDEEVGELGGHVVYRMEVTDSVFTVVTSSHRLLSAHRNALGPVDEEVGKLGGQYGGLHR